MAMHLKSTLALLSTQPMLIMDLSKWMTRTMMFGLILPVTALCLSLWMKWLERSFGVGTSS